jgi:hypothetical protein
MSEQQRCLQTNHLFPDKEMVSVEVEYLELEPTLTVNFDLALFTDQYLTDSMVRRNLP